jgi:hypothetical protein
MSLSRGPKIVTNGLVLYLDAANTKSYSGSGTAWYNLSGNSNTGTLTNGPTFSAGNQGSIVFDGVNDNVLLSSTAGLTNNFTIDLWCLPNATHEIDSESTSGTTGISGQRYIVEAEHQGSNGGAGISIGTNGVSVYEHGDSYLPALLVYSTTISSASHIVVVYTSKQPTLYINSSNVRTGLTSPKTTVYLSTPNIGGFAYGYFSGNIYTVKFYNRSLSATEILQNYNATKRRFGL